MSNPDKVMHPKQSSRVGGIKQMKSSSVEGPTASTENLTPYNRNKKK